MKYTIDLKSESITHSAGQGIFFRIALILAVCLSSAPSVWAQEFSFTDRQVTRAALIEQLSKDPRAMAIAQTRAVAARRGFQGTELDRFVENYANNYNAQVGLLETGRLPMSSRDSLLQDLAKLAFQTTVETYVPGSSALTGILVDAGLDQLEDYIASDSIDFAGEFLADRKYDSVVNVERVTDYILDTPGIREGLIFDTGVDVDKSALEQIAQYPSVGNGFLNRELITGVQANGRALLAIADDIAQVDMNNDARVEQLTEELTIIFDEGLSRLNEDIGAGIESIVEQNELIRDEIESRSLVLEGEIGKNREILTSYIQNQVAREQARLDAEEALRKKREEAASLRSTLQATASLLDLMSPGLGEKYSVITNSVMQIRDAVETFRSIKQGIGIADIAQLGAGIANPTMAIFSVMGNSGPSADEQILGQLAKISEQIHELRMEMHERFDAVDLKLDQILLEIETGLDILSTKDTIILDATIRNLQVGLDTQSLIISESRKLGDQIRASVLVPCIERASTLPLPDEKFIDCVSFLYNNATDGVISRQTKYNPSDTADTFAVRLEATDGSSNDILKNEFEKRSNLVLSGNMAVSVVDWATAVTWYLDFLLKDLNQTNRNIVPLQGEKLIQMGSELREFQEAALSSFEGYPLPPGPGVLTPTVYQPFPQETADYRAPVSFLARGREFRQRLQEMMDNAAEEYRNSTGFTSLGDLDQEFESLVVPRGYRIKWVYAPGSNPISDAGAQVMLNLLPYSLIAATYHGLGKFEINVRYTGTRMHSHSCGFLGTSRFHISDWDKYVATIRFVTPSGIGVSSKQVGSINFRYPNYDGEIRHGCGGFVAAGPKFCRTGACLGSTVVSTAAGAFQKTPIPTASLAAAWNKNRNNVAGKILAVLNEQELDADIVLENAYFSALTRFAFGDNILESDAVFSFANGSAGIPLISEFANKIEDIRRTRGDAVALQIVWQVNDLFSDELSAIRDYFATGAIEQEIAAAKLSIGISHTNAKIRNADRLVQAVSAGDYVPPDQTSVTPDSESPGGTDVTLDAGDLGVTEKSGGAGLFMSPPLLTIFLVVFILKGRKRYKQKFLGT